ncbi:MAG: hypothetical protein ACHQYP_02260 [Nitrospiria bacterium]
MTSIFLFFLFFFLNQPDLVQAQPGLPDIALDIPLAGNVQIPMSNGKIDNVPINGIFHVVSHVSNESAKIEYRFTGSMSNVSGTGDYTGLVYEADNSGLEIISQPQIKGNNLDIFVRTYLLTTVSTRMYPPNPCPAGGNCIIPLNLHFTTSFDPTGLMNDITINELSIPASD